MKKLLNKIFKKNNEIQSDSRITTETVARHRQQILAGGRRFKYPLQYAKHKLVYNAVIISVSVLTVASLVGWWLLYPMQNTSTFMYKITSVLPLPVARIDRQIVNYSDYLLKYRSSVYYLQQKEQVSFSSEDGKRQVDYIKQQSMRDAAADAYAYKLSKGLKLSVSDREVGDFIDNQRKLSNEEVSAQTYEAVISDYYGWNMNEYRHVTHNKLLRQKVSYAVDTAAKDLSKVVNDRLSANLQTDFKSLVSELSPSGSNLTYGTSGWVAKANQDGGLAVEAAKLQKGQISQQIKSDIGDGYYYLRLVDVNDSQVNYEYIQIQLTAFGSQFDALYSGDGFHKYINV